LELPVELEARDELDEEEAEDELEESFALFEPHALNAMLQAIANILNLNDSFMVKLLNVIMVFWNDGDKIFDNYLHQTN